MKRVAFIACAVIGYLIGHYFGQGAVAVYASILISYHLYLGYLVIVSEKETGLSLPIGMTILTHAACVALVAGLAMARHFIPFFAIVRLFIPGIAPFEVMWLFSGGKKKAAPVRDAIGEPAAAPAPLAAPLAAAIPVADAPAIAARIAAAAAARTAPAATTTFVQAPFAAAAPVHLANVTGAEYDEFLAHMRQYKRPFRKPGHTVKEEFEWWLAARHKGSAAAHSRKTHA